MDFLIIGGDAAGMSAASRAKRNHPDLNVTVLEKTGDVSYSACGMPYNIADPQREIEDLVVRAADVFRKKQNINLLTRHEATHIDPKAQIVTGIDPQGNPFEMPYDKLLVATGARPAIPEFAKTPMPGVMVLKSLDQGRKIKAYLKEKFVKKVCIVGMGYIALEMSEALRALDIAVAMIKPRSQLLPWMAQELSDVVKKELETKGVELLLGYDLETIEAFADHNLRIISKEKSFECDMVLLATGVVPNSEMAKEAGINLGPGNSIAVGKNLCTSENNIFAAGDCADAYHVVTGEKTWIPLALRANRAGWAVADNVCGKQVELPGVAGTAVFKVFDLEVARTGLSMKESQKAGFEPAEMIIQARSRAHAHKGSQPIWVQLVGDKVSGRLLGVQMVGREGVAHRINAPAVALTSRMTVSEFVQCDLAYAPPFGPVWDPMLTAANQWLKSF